MFLAGLSVTWPVNVLQKRKKIELQLELNCDKNKEILQACKGWHGMMLQQHYLNSTSPWTCFLQVYHDLFCMQNEGFAHNFLCMDCHTMTRQLKSVLKLNLSWFLSHLFPKLFISIFNIKVVCEWRQHVSHLNWYHTCPYVVSLKSVYYAQIL